MKKKIAAVIALMLLICITATGCAEADQVKVEMYMYLKMVQRFRSLMECVFLFRKIWNQITRL